VKLSIRLVALLVLPLVCCSRGKDKADEALEQAQQFAAQGKFEEALQKHIWYHDHALEINQAHYGVRLSFALSYWIDLGKKYPKALDALKDIRDKKVARLVAGENNWLLFHEIVAINDQLGEVKATVELFKKIEVAQPEFASSISDLADEAFFAAKEYALERKYLGDPCSRFDRAKSRLDWGLNYALTSRYPARSRQSFEIIFSREVVRLIVVLDQTGDGDLARQIQSDALAACNTAAIRDALTKELTYSH
jgi:tetratricopeptide (TPR) repeat protein